MLTEQERKKYNRQLLLEEIGEAGQEKLKQAKVLVVGAGGLGCAVLPYLAAAGIGTIGIVDFDTVEAPNLQRQVLFTEDDIGKRKALISADKIIKQNSLIKISPHPERLTTENAEQLFNLYEIIVDCTDNFSSRYLINDACMISGKPMVYGSVHRFEGQVSVFNFSKENNSPTYRCLFESPPETGTILSCSEVGVLGVLPGIIGMMQASEAIKIITGIGSVLSGKLVCFNALAMSFSTIEFERNKLADSRAPSTWDQLRKTDYSFDCETICDIQIVFPEQLQLLIDNQEDILFLDVRNILENPVLTEWNSLRIPSTEIEKHIDEINHEKKVVVFCRSGNRSKTAVSILQNKFHFTNVYNLEGGLEEWFRFKKQAVV